MEIPWANLFRVLDIRFSKCSDIDNVYRRKHSTFAIHGSGLALGNVLLPSCCVSCRTLRKSNILHSHKFAHGISTAANPLNLQFRITYFTLSSTTLHLGSFTVIVFPFALYAVNSTSFTVSGASNVLWACISSFVTTFASTIS